MIGEEALGRRPKHRDYFGIYRPQAEIFGGRSDGKFGAVCQESRDFQCLEVPETIEWELGACLQSLPRVAVNS